MSAGTAGRRGLIGNATPPKEAIDARETHRLGGSYRARERAPMAA
jgi:hypothetical protein